MIERIIWVVVVAVLGVSLYITQAEKREMSAWVDQQNEQLREIDAIIDDAVNDRSDVTATDTPQPEADTRTPRRTASPPPTAQSLDLIPEWEVRSLKSKGLDDPINDLKQNLIDRPELIIYDGVLGGTMRVYSKESITLLPGSWAFAEFEDGHINGGLFLQYSVQNGNIDWEVIRRKLY